MVKAGQSQFLGSRHQGPNPKDLNPIGYTQIPGRKQGYALHFQDQALKTITGSSPPNNVFSIHLVIVSASPQKSPL